MLRGSLNYEDFVGVWANRGELLAQAAYIHFLGASFAGSLDDVPPALFLAVCDDEATAFEMMCRVNSARSDAKARRQQQPGVHTSSLF